MNSSILGRLEYLNQTSRVLVGKSVPLSTLVNTPYKIYRSFCDAIMAQYVISLENPDNLPFNTKTFITSMGYFFSSYAIGCFLIALVLSRLSAMSSLRSNIVCASIPKWSSASLHIMAIATIFYALYSLLVQYNILVMPGSIRTKDVRTFLSETYVVLAFSHFIETFLSITTNMKSLEESDYTIFELSAQFYIMTRGNATVYEYGPDCLMALAGRLIIHLVELFKRRQRRLVWSTILNTGFIIYLTYEIYYNGIGSLSLFTKWKHFPKFLSVFIIIISLACYFLACIVRWNPTHAAGISPVEDLQSYSFVRNSLKHLNLTGEEEFSSAVMKLAVLFCNPAHKCSRGLHRELPAISTAASLHKSYIVSGYMNKMANMPDAVIGAEVEKQQHSRSIMGRFSWAYQLLTILFVRIKYILGMPSKTKHQPKDIKIMNAINFNEYINEKNYKNFMITESHEKFKFLLPEDDNSPDYEFNELDSASECDSYLDDHHALPTEEIQEDILKEIISPHSILEIVTSPEDLSWYISMWGILKCETVANKRLTRSQYANMNEVEIINGVIMENLINGNTKRHAAVSIQKETLESENHVKIDISCVVCKENQRTVVVWPCRCFSLCEECRVSLGLRGFSSCVCCRAEVRGYSKLNTV